MIDQCLQLMVVLFNHELIPSLILIYRVTLADQTTYDARVVGFDQDKDVAVLRVDAPKDKLRPIPVGISADLLVGQKVFAIGNPVSMSFYTACKTYTFIALLLECVLFVFWVCEHTAILNY